MGVVLGAPPRRPWPDPSERAFGVARLTEAGRRGAPYPIWRVNGPLTTMFCVPVLDRLNQPLEGHGNPVRV